MKRLATPRFYFIKFLLINCFCLAQAQEVPLQKHIDTICSNINGISVHYQVYGGGEPLLLLHGNQGSSADFFSQIPEFEKYFTVIAMDSRGQGKTSDGDSDITYELMALDAAKLIDTLGYKQVNIVGWSDGANVGLELTKKFPGKIAKMVMFAGNYKIDTTVVPHAFIDSLAHIVDTVSTATKKKLIEMLLLYPRLSIADLQMIRVPILVMAGEHDLIKEGHTREMQQHLPNSKMFIAKGANHWMPVEQPDEFNKVVLDYFLADKPVRKLSGVVANPKNKEGLEYVNIGISKKNWGTVSIKNGRFSMGIPYRFLKDTLTFSLVGYETIQLPVASFSGKADTVFMPDKIITLPQVQVVAKAPKRKRIGIRTHSPILMSGDSYEFSYLIAPQKLPIKLEKVNAYMFLKKEDSCSFRINIYRDLLGVPEHTPSNSIIIRCKAKPGWNEFDLSSWGLLMNEKFYIGIEELPDLTSNTKHDIRFGFVMHGMRKTFVRSQSLGIWTKTPGGNISIYVTVLTK